MKIYNVMAYLLCGAMALGFTSCGDDDDEPVAGGNNVATVFPAGVPSSVGAANITKNAEGKVIKIDDGYDVTEFEYGSFTHGTTYQVKMTQYDKEQPSDKLTIFMQLNAQGYVSHALEVYSDDEYSDDTWDFGYNADGQLNYMKRSEGDNEITTITYTNGNITKVSVVDDDHQTPSIAETFYTSTDVTTPLENKGGIMFWYYTFGIDMDEMEVIYYAGLLGKATKNLPVSMKDGEDISTFDWTFNSEDLPVKVTIDNSWSSYKSSYEIKW